MLIGERAARVSCPYQLIQGASWQGDMGSACTAREGTSGQGDTGTRGSEGRDAVAPLSNILYLKFKRGLAEWRGVQC